MNKFIKLLSFILCLAFSGVVSAADKPIVGLVIKTDSNPFFVKMKEGAQKKADELGLELKTYAGRFDGDNQSQAQAIENLVVAGAKGILITPSNPAEIVPVVEMARSAGVLVIALDTPLSPADAADATFATDNFKAGELIGEWAKAKLGDKAASAKIALLDLNANEISVDVARNQGFLKGFGIDVKNAMDIGDESDSRIVGNEVTQGSVEGGRKAIETLLQKDTGINVVYTINEPAAIGAYEALSGFGMKDALIVSVDGGCEGVKNVQSGVIGATSMQFPLRMAAMGVEAVDEFVKTGKKPQNTKGLDFLNTGVELITDSPVAGIESKSSADGLSLCW
ncbi:substrate-binding domain-containing protein [Vibrio salinus]|uniref:substrate-binding domain-containing protein n=1 Tax=Vibrio salinus TaxID=2899784 RepID=UPI001E2F9861|nr:substrate-binding domain-containing protein [Vibrio salinus]MCE0495610.1 substrate-binding domain-containing protein [Vibrio salinus]